MDQPTAAKLTHDIEHLRIDFGLQVHVRIEVRLARQNVSVIVGPAIRFLRVDQAFIHRRIGGKLPEFADHRRNIADPVHVRDLLRKAQEESQLHHVSDLRLAVSHDMSRRLKPLSTGNVDVLVDEDPLPRHENIIVNQQRVRLVEARRKRIVIHTVGCPCVGPAREDLYTGRIAGHRN